MYLRSISPHITGPTRITNQKPSLINNIYYNNLEIPCISGNLISKISDNLPNFIVIKMQNMNKNENKCNDKIRDMSKFDENKFKSDLALFREENK